MYQINLYGFVLTISVTICQGVNDSNFEDDLNNLDEDLDYFYNYEAILKLNNLENDKNKNITDFDFAELFFNNFDDEDYEYALDYWEENYENNEDEYEDNSKEEHEEDSEDVYKDDAEDIFIDFTDPNVLEFVSIQEGRIPDDVVMLKKKPSKLKPKLCLNLS